MVTILRINSSSRGRGNRSGRANLRAAGPLSAACWYTGRRPFHLRETRLAEPARRKERDKQVGARRGSEYLLPSGIPSLQRRPLSLSLSRSRRSSFPLRVVFLCLARFLPESPATSPRESRTSVVRQSVSRRVINQSYSRTCETRSAALARLPRAHTYHRERIHSSTVF